VNYQSFSQWRLLEDSASRRAASILIGSSPDICLMTAAAAVGKAAAV